MQELTLITQEPPALALVDDPRIEAQEDVAIVYSVVVPMLNEQGTVGALGLRLAQVMDELAEPSEVILVDDGSTDGTYPLMLELRARDPRFKVISFSRNFGHQVAITAGLDAAAGKAIVIMDGDLQHPPELVHEMVARWNEGYEIVYGVQVARTGQSFAKRSTASLFYRLLRVSTQIQAPAGAGDFRLVDRSALEAFKALREGNRFVRGMWDWIGFKQFGIPYTPPERYEGKPKYSARKLLRLALDGILSFSNLPLRAALTVGTVVSLLSFALGLSALGSRLLGQHLVPGWTTLMLVTSFGIGIQLIVLGVLGEYIGRIYEEVKARPIYIARARHGLVGRAVPARAAIVDDV